MILNDRWIKLHAELSEMIKPFEEKCLNSFGYDLRLGKEFLIPLVDLGKGTVIDPKAKSLQYGKFVAEEGFCIIPGSSFVLGCSIEYVKMPTRVTGLCFGRSTYSRCGIIAHPTPLEAGWEGQVTIELSNSSSMPAKVYVNEGITQVVFFAGDEPARTYVTKGGRYQGQKGVTPARSF